MKQLLCAENASFVASNSVAPVPPCPKCQGGIGSDDINVVTDIAYCRRCNLPHKFSALIRGAQLEIGIDLERPPVGTRYQSSPLETVIGASHRSWGATFGLLAISLFWNGILSIFVLFAISGTLSILGLPSPTWFPAPKMNGGPMGVGMTIFLWIFLTPFIVIGLAMAGAFLSTLAGRTEIRLRSPEGVIFSGIGSLGWRRPFQMAEVSDVRIHDQSWRDSDGDARKKTDILLETSSGKEIKFGSMLAAERRQFVAAALRKCLSVAR